MKAVTAPLIERVQTRPDLMNHLPGKSKSTKTNYRAADSHGVWVIWLLPLRFTLRSVIWSDRSFLYRLHGGWTPCSVKGTVHWKIKTHPHVIISFFFPCTINRDWCFKISVKIKAILGIRWNPWHSFSPCFYLWMNHSINGRLNQILFTQNFVLNRLMR